MIDLYSDEVIFRMQRAGGVSVYCGELLSRAIDDPDIDVHILDSGAQIENIVYTEKGLMRARGGKERFGNLMAQRVLQVNIEACDGVEEGVFHGTYFRTAKNPRIKNILTVHDFTHQKYFKGQQKFLNDVLKRKTIARADAIICISENTKRDLLELYPNAGKKRTEVVYNGASKDYRPLLNRELSDKFSEVAEQPFLLYVGARTSYKNFKFAIELIKELPRVNLVVAGGASLTEEERSMADGACGRVFHFGNLGNDELNLLYNNAAALIYPSLYEGFGIPLLEAMKAGCPVIAFNNSSIPEVLGGSGVLLENNDLRGAVKVVRRLMGDARCREEIVASQIEASKRFSWDSCYKQTKTFYMDVLGL